MSPIRPISLISTIVLLLLLLSSCDRTIHEYPVPSKSLVVLQLNVERGPLKLYKRVTYDNYWNREVADYGPDDYSGPYPASDGLQLRIVVDVMRGPMPATTSGVDWRNRVERRVVYVDRHAQAPQDTLHLYLDNGQYYVLAWADYASELSAPASAFYEADTLTAVHTSFANYPMTSLDRSVAAGQQQFRVNFDLSPEGYPSLEANAGVPVQSRVIPVYLERPVGLFRVYATDYLKFVGQGDYLGDLTIRCTYKMFVGAGFNVLTDEPNQFIGTYSFLTAPMGEDTRSGEEVFIFGDYLFTRPEQESNIVADFEFIRADGSLLGRIENISYPVLRRHETVIRGHFLTGGDREGEGGVQIDERFDGEYVVHFEW